MVFHLCFLTEEKIYIIYRNHLAACPEFSCHHVQSVREASDHPSPVIFLSDTDSGIEKVKQTGLPVIGISHPDNSAESLMACPWLVTCPEAINETLLNRIWHHHHGLPLTILETDRAILREFDQGDLPVLIQLQEENAADPDASFFPEDCHDPADFLDNYIRFQYSFYDWGIYAIVKKDENEMIGMAGFSLHPERDASDGRQGSELFQVGYTLIKKWQKKGILSEILPPLLSYAADCYPDWEPVCVSRPDNAASIRLARKNGLKIIMS